MNIEFNETSLLKIFLRKNLVKIKGIKEMNFKYL